MYFKHQLLPLLGALTIGSQAATTLARCNANNCYRALFPCPDPSAVSAASAFCATITASGTTATNFPARATKACSTAAAPYISACACGLTCLATPSSTPTSTPCVPYGGLLPSGDFECGIEPWTADTYDANSRVGITSASANSGKQSFEAALLADRPLPQPPVVASLKSRSVSVQRNVPCKLTFAVWFDGPDAGFVGVRFNGVAGRTVDARDGAGWGVWKTMSVDYTPDSENVEILFEFVSGRDASLVRLDSVVFNYLR
ncbi:hypothetical protein CMUS01_11812 [Colletotrichum musicola]|uniref:Uncharacterized protein n=1 Tax=Colletotrichum musicola TaxID=2175873 RepID=A0A8H6JTE1_9PEZI|nr:hypothetical protein CMUS01_11812 [Colletotrichum musicola]